MQFKKKLLFASYSKHDSTDQDAVITRSATLDYNDSFCDFIMISVFWSALTWGWAGEEIFCSPSII